MKFSFFKLILLLNLVQILTGYYETIEREPPETVSEVLNELVRSASYQYINLDELQVQEIDLAEENIIYNVVGEMTRNHHPILGHLTDIPEEIYFILLCFSNIE